LIIIEKYKFDSVPKQDAMGYLKQTRKEGEHFDS